MFSIRLAFLELENDIDNLNQTKLSIKADDVVRLSVSMFHTMDLSGPPFSQCDDDSGTVHPNSKCSIRDRASKNPNDFPFPIFQKFIDIDLNLKTRNTI